MFLGKKVKRNKMANINHNKRSQRKRRKLKTKKGINSRT